MADDLDDILGEDDDFASLFEDEGEEDDFASLFEDDGEEDMASLFEDGDDENDLTSLFGDDDDGEEEEDDDGGSILGDILGAVTGAKPEPILPYKKEKRKARLDITKKTNTLKRYTKTELREQLKRDYKYALGKSYMMIQPVTIMKDYPYKKKKSDSDEVKDYNTDYDYVMVIGKLLKWRSTEEFRGKAYKLGEIMYMKRGVYWVNGTQMLMKPHYAIVINRSYKRIKSKRIRDLLAPLKQRLRAGKPFSIYKEFPIIVERTGVFS